MTFRRGEIWYIDNSKIINNNKSKGSRPAVIVSNNRTNRGSQYIDVVFLTTKRKQALPTHVNIQCRYPSVARCENVYTIPKNRFINRVKECTEYEIKDLNKALILALGIKV